jgi:tRNA pseudouridine-54 N-methylase
MFDNRSFPISEIMLSNYFAKLILEKKEKRIAEFNPLNPVIYSQLNIFEEIKKFKNKGYKIFVLSENGVHFNNVTLLIKKDDDLLFIIGDQTGNLVNAEDLKQLNLLDISLGKQSYLASSVIRLIKINLNLLLL